MEENNRQEIMIRASNNSGLTKDMLIDTWYIKGLMGVYNLGLEHMLSYLEKNDKTKAFTPTLWGDGYSDGELVYDMYEIALIVGSIMNYITRNMITALIAVRR